MAIPASWYVIAGLVASLGVQEYRVQTKKVAVLECKSEQAAAQILGQQRLAQTQTDWIQGSNGIVGWETRALSARESDLRASSVASDRLRDRIATLKLTAAHCTAPPPVGQDVVPNDPSGMLAVMSERLDRVAGVYAKVADDRRDVGLSCESRYELIRTGVAPPERSVPSQGTPTIPEAAPAGK